MPIGAFRLNGLGKSASGPSQPYTDPYAEYLWVALPFNSTYQFDDISHLFAGNPRSASQTPRVGISGAPTIATSSSQTGGINGPKYYGSCYYAGSRTGSRLSYNLPGSGFNFSTGVWCIEFWAFTSNTNSLNWIWGADYYNPEQYIAIFKSSSDSIQTGNEKRIATSTTNWRHWAFVRNGTTSGAIFRDGVRVATSCGAGNGVIPSMCVGGAEPNDPNHFIGGIQDYRVYLGTTKYSPSSSSITVPGAMYSV